ncbi:hypothetical protein ACIA59_16335 [Micromonospora haikouensis]|uniref:hypothetical protein n=1 Tax=Micromonospora haikouensis TaxID=686309 RepID=UPI00378D4E30
MSSLLLQLPALVGVLIGAVATYVATTMQERSRWRRLQAVRWDERRIAAYTEYAHAIKKVISIAVRLAAARGVHRDDSWFRAEGTEAELIEAEEERTTKWEAVLMLGDESVVAAAREWHQATFRLMRLAAGQSSDMTWNEAIAAVSQVRGRFYAAARADLGVKLGGSSEPYEWQMARWLTESANSRRAESEVMIEEHR